MCRSVFFCQVGSTRAPWRPSRPEQVPGPIQTFAVGFAEEEANERPYARLVADAIGAEHREVCVTSDEYFDALPDLIWHQDEPMAFSSGVPLYFVSRLARDHVKVVLTGEGADELFLGYNRYRVSYWNSRLSRTYGTRGQRRGPHTDRSTRASNFRAPPAAMPRAHFLRSNRATARILFDNFAVFSERAQRDLLPPARLRSATRTAFHFAATTRRKGARSTGSARRICKRICANFS